MRDDRDDVASEAGRPVWRVTADDVQLIARGAGVLGSGGGGDPYLGQLLTVTAARDGRHGAIVPLDSLDDESVVMAVGQIGTATVFAERLARGQEAVLAIAAVERHMGTRASALVCYEIGGINSVLTLAAAAACGLPVVDADLMGRAFPELQMTTLDIGGAPSAPVAVCDDRGNVTIIAASEDMAWTERLARALLSAMGGLAYVARPVMRAADLKRLAIGGSYSRARAIGDALRRARADGTPVELALAPEGARLALRGTISAVERRARGRAMRGSVVVQTHGRAGAVSRIDFQNEYLIVRQGSEALATVPDIICVIDEETGTVVDTGAVQAGLRVIVLVLPADRKLTTPAALRLVGPGAFGYEMSYREWSGTERSQ